MNGVTRTEWEDRVRALSEQRTKDQDIGRKLRRIQQAELAMGQLTADKHWNAYCSMVQAKIDEEQKAADAIEASMRGSTYLDDETVRKLRHDLVVLRARIEARQDCIRLPAEIIGGK